MDFETKVEIAAEKAREADILAHERLADITSEAPTLAELFLRDAQTFDAWIGDAICGAQSTKTMAPIREMIMYEDDAQLGLYVRTMVMDYINNASREAE